MPTSSNIEPFEDHSVHPSVRGFLHRPANSTGDGLILTHGAGSDSRAPLLVAMAETFSQAGLTLLRCDLPFRQRSPHGPPRPGDAARDREGLKHAVSAVQKLIPGRVFLGGLSYGGRQASMLSSVEPDLAAGLILFSYPLHPPRQPTQLRVQHLPKLRTPTLFVHGTRDPFGSIEEMENAVGAIRARTKLIRVEGAGHDLDFGRDKKEAGKPELPAIVLAHFQRFFT